MELEKYEPLEETPQEQQKLLQNRVVLWLSGIAFTFLLLS